MARIGSARCALQIDVGFGDAATPGPQTVAYPTLLGGFPAPTLCGLSVHIVIAEKDQAMIILGHANNGDCRRGLQTTATWRAEALRWV